MKTVITQYITKTVGQSYIDDLHFILGDNFNIFNMLNAKTLRHPDSEVNFRKKYLISNIHSKLNKRIQLLPHHQLRTGRPESRFLFVNGVVTPYALALHQAKVLSQCINQDVELLHNETEGLVRDLIECNQGRYGILNKVAQDAVETIIDKLKYDGDLHIVAHSQGAIIITSAILELAKSLPENFLSRIKFYTFGAGFKESILPECIEAEHFANKLDPITHLGLQNQGYNYSGKLYLRENKGHFFIADYLHPLILGEFEAGSNFETLISKENN
jgi:hypothetical protein